MKNSPYTHEAETAKGHAADCGTCAYHPTCTGKTGGTEDPKVYYEQGAWRCDQYKPLAGTPGPRIDIET